MFERGVSFVPSAAPAGRACENWPVAYTRFPTISWAHTTPLICTVGNAAADTVSGVEGSTGAVSAAAGVLATPDTTNARFAPTSTTASRLEADLRTVPPDDVDRARGTHPNTTGPTRRKEEHTPLNTRLRLDFFTPTPHAHDREHERHRGVPPVSVED
jgi:hypothetical protein